MFPASAGMMDYLIKDWLADDCVPRIRGDDPVPLLPAACIYMCSPHPRG